MATLIKNTDYQVIDFDDNSMNKAIAYWTDEQISSAVEVLPLTVDENETNCPEAGIDHNIPVAIMVDERMLDMNNTNIPVGATVKLIAEIAGGPDKVATESFIYYPESTSVARYNVSGTTLISDLEHLGIISYT